MEVSDSALPSPVPSCVIQRFCCWTSTLLVSFLSREECQASFQCSPDTAALDAQSEKVVHQTLMEASKGRTTVYVTLYRTDFVASKLTTPLSVVLLRIASLPCLSTL